MALGTYSFLDTVATISGPGGVFQIGSSAGVADEGITVEMIEEKDNMKVSADGQAMHALNAASSAKIRVRLLKTSPVNALLGGMYNFQTASSLNHGQNTIVITDVARGDVITASQVAFVKFPNISYAKDPAMNEWEFNAGVVNQLLGAG